MARRPATAGLPWDLVEQLREKLSHGWPAGLTLLTGEDLYHLDAAQRLLIQALLADEEPGMALTVHGSASTEDRTDVGAVVAAARSRGMFASRRVVLVRDGAALTGKEAPLSAYAAAPPPQSYLIVRAPKLDSRLKLHQALRSGTVLDFALCDNVKALTERVRVLAGAKGLQIRRDAAAFLAEACGGDLYRVDGDLEKLLIWLESEASREVNLELVQGLTSGGRVLTVWQMADAIVSGDRAGALNGLQQLLDAGEEPLRLLGGLAYRARGMLQNNRALLAYPALLLEADRTLKSRAIAPSAVLGILVERMIRVAADGRMAP